MRHNNLALRIAAAIITIASILWGHWWLAWGLAVISLFLFPSYYEIILWGVAYDSLYGLALPHFWGITYVFTLASFILFILSIYLRKMLLAYDSQI